MPKNVLKIHAIVNPFSGLSSKKNIEQKLASAFSNKARYNFSINKTEYAGHAKTLSEEAVKNQADIVIAIGGDGTINEVAVPLINTEVVLGIISMGSGNGFARHMGLHLPLDEAIQNIKKNEVTTIDTCQINGYHYINLTGIGFDAQVALNTKNNKSRGLWQYIKASLNIAFEKNTLIGEVCFEDKCIRGEFKSIIIANASRYGFNFSIAPFASLQDGVLDVMLLKEASFLRYLRVLPKFMTKKIHLSDLVSHYQTEKLTIKLEESRHYHIDGEGIEQKESHFEIMTNPRSLNIITCDRTAMV